MGRSKNKCHTYEVRIFSHIEYDDTEFTEVLRESKREALGLRMKIQG